MRCRRGRRRRSTRARATTRRRTCCWTCWRCGRMRGAGRRRRVRSPRGSRRGRRTRRHRRPRHGGPIRRSTRSSARRRRWGSPCRRRSRAADAPAGAASAPLIRRYLAARLIACWPLHYGTGARDRDRLRRGSPQRPRRGDRPAGAGRPDGAGDAAVLAAIAETDRLVVHLAAPDALARGLDAWAVRHLDGGL